MAQHISTLRKFMVLGSKSKDRVPLPIALPVIGDRSPAFRLYGMPFRRRHAPRNGLDPSFDASLCGALQAIGQMFVVQQRWGNMCPPFLLPHGVSCHDNRWS